MRRALAAAAVLAVVGCKQQPPPATTTVVEWAQQSPDGRFELRQRREGTGCHVQAVVKSADGDRSLWSTQTCLPTPSGLVFLSPNGERVLVLDLFPSSQAARTSDWSSVPLISLWARGAIVRQYTGTELLGEALSSDMGKVLSWVRGDTFEDAHRAARPSPDGEHVTIALVDGRVLELGFEGNALPAPSPPPASARQAARAADEPPPLEPVLAGRPAQADEPRRGERSDRSAELLAGDEQGLYRWEDDQGGLHFGAGSQIPAPYRKRARPVDATVGVVPVEKPVLAPAPSAAPGPAGPAAIQPAGAQPGAGAPAAPASPAPAPAGAAPAGSAAPPAPPPS